ncbi:adenylyltransferase/cytidyltransferase family protein [Bacillus cereus group sp. MYBK139-2]|uniref:adenylyltransferase/cytidyltransferase family protein n=1 Tax=unclassified Bacillus cereus group TaxID=2750818 RepID=UPI003F7A52D1
MKTFKLGFVIGRFQHIHLSHKKMINTALQSCERVILMVGSSQESGTERNPFNLYTRMNLIREVFKEEIKDGTLLLAHTDDMTHEDDHSTAWGDFLIKKIDMWRSHYAVQDEVDCFIYGNDEERTAWFKPKDIEKISHIVLSRKADSLNATGVRKLLVEDNVLAWEESVPSEIIPSYDELRAELLQVMHYKLLNTESQITVNDEERVII